MKITEQDIERSITEIQESTDTPAIRFEKHSESFPALTSFLFSDDLDMLTDDEKSLMMFLGDVVFNAWLNVTNDEAICSVEEVEEMLGTVAEKWEEESAMGEKMDMMFEGEEEIELMALVEDLTSDEEEISFTGKTAIVITLKTIIQCLQLDGGE